MSNVGYKIKLDPVPILSSEPRRTDLPLCLQIALHRLITFLLSNIKCDIDFHRLAESGLYFSKDRTILKCHFCDFQIPIENVTDFEEIHRFGTSSQCRNYPWTTNVPIGNLSMLNYKFEVHRLYSLLKKPNWRFVHPVDLALNGFYYTGDEDNCRCVFCNLEVRGWEEGDTVEREHNRWNPNCPLLKNSSSVINIRIGDELDLNQGENVASSNRVGTNPFKIVAGLDSKYGPCVKLTELAGVVTPSTLGIMDWVAPQHPQYATMNSRVATFKNWPRSMAQRPEEMAAAGFLYTSGSDRTVCFHCNLGLKDWARDDAPAVQHAKWNSACQYLMLTKGVQFVQNLLCSTAEEKKTVNKSSARSNEDLVCVECKKAQVSKVALPCGHINLCSACKEEKCRICQEEVKAEVHIFFG
ncbi:baculoviral IAP repeat-containing protein 7-B-like [Neocloeon triangulifer]|uniref:baculoviral IAP repeat-containing protein 7-B-like n=1 Tax=Neocloeon triangulifer TaxID=2078957 RepID=UPI00286EF9EC|nr:baculoviral IAP repeat-containing protein 7-B-like [Neocloeon triangulifer]